MRVKSSLTDTDTYRRRGQISPRANLGKVKFNGTIGGGVSQTVTQKTLCGSCSGSRTESSKLPSQDCSDRKSPSQANVQEDNQKTSRGPKSVKTGVLCDKRKSYQIEKKAGQVFC